MTLPIVDSVRCPSCRTAPADRFVGTTADGHGIIVTGTGRAVACSGDGGYYPRRDPFTSTQTEAEAVRTGARWRASYSGFLGPVVRYFVDRKTCVTWARVVGKYDVARIERIGGAR